MLNKQDGCMDVEKSKIPQSDVDLLLNAINKIVDKEVLEKSLSDVLPIMDTLSDSNKIYYGKVSMLFVDMRESTKLPDRFNMEQLVKIYRSYIRTVVQAIRYSGGVVRDFMGDGVLAAFIDNEEGASEDKAVYAARYLITAIDQLLNPVLDKAVGHRISCGVGIHTGEIALSKVGMKGKGQTEDDEEEFGMAWIGNSTNLACKYSGAVGNGTIFISPSTYSALSDLEEKQQWKEIEVSKGNNILRGFVAEKYYLNLDKEVEPCIAQSDGSIRSLVDELKEIYEKQLSDLSIKIKNLAKKEDELRAKERYLVTKEEEISRREEEHCELSKKLLEAEYDFYRSVLGSGHCKREYVRAMGAEFWEKQLEGAIGAGSKLGKSFREVRQNVSYAMVSIYESLEAYTKAYDFLVEQATGYAWLHLSTVQNIVTKVGYFDRLRSAIYRRLGQSDLTPEHRPEFEKIKNWLDSKLSL